MVNKSILVGYLGKDPDLRYSPDGKAVARVSLATSEKYKKEGQTVEKTEWHRLVFFGRLAEIVGEYLKSGSMIYVEGRLSTRKWQGRDGQDRYTTEVIATEMRMLKNIKEKEPRAETSEPQQGGFNDFDDDIPF